MGHQNIKCMVVDDEVIARKGLINQLKSFESISVVDEASSVTQLFQKLKSHQLDVVFLDIMLRNQNVLHHFEQLENKPTVVFVSAYREFAVEGFDLNVADYLLKPVTETRLAKCVQKLIALNMNAQTQHNEVLFLKSSGKLFRVEIDDILYIKSMENYVQVFVKDKRLICKSTIGQLADKLKDFGFVQVHRSYVVNTHKIESIAKLKITIGESQIPISREKKKEIYAQIVGTEPGLHLTQHQ